MAKSVRKKRDNTATQFTMDTPQPEYVIPEDSGIEIRGATLVGDFLKYSYDLNIDANTKDSISNRKGGKIIHDDLRLLYKKLSPHLAVICERIPINEITDIEDIEEYDADKHDEGGIEHRVSHFPVSSFTISGTGENEGVVIKGLARLSNGEYIGEDTYDVKWTGDYAFINELRALVDELKIEVEKYMMGKSAPRLVQQEMTFPETGENDDNE